MENELVESAIYTLATLGKTTNNVEVLKKLLLSIENLFAEDGRILRIELAK